jgi:DNA-binding response OmpR family regulator
VALKFREEKKKMTKILLVEDDGQIASYLGELLRAEGFDTQIAGSKKEASECLLIQAFDLVLLDVSLPDGNGFSICAEIKKEYEIPVIFLTASGDEYSVVAGLDMGADDYIAKPFRPRELISRIRSVLRRCKKEQRILSCGDLRVNVSSATVTKGEKELFLSALEYRLLLLLLQNKGQILTRNQLLEEIWDASGEYVNDNTLSVYMKRLREKIEENPQSPRLLHTIRGIGYRMEDRTE